jgi:hypothetical protein
VRSPWESPFSPCGLDVFGGWPIFDISQTFTDESENPPTTKEPSCEIDEQFSLCPQIMIREKDANWQCQILSHKEIYPL